MPVTTHFESDGQVLFVKSTGTTSSVQDILTYAESILGYASKHDIDKIIIDETELVYGTGTLDIYESAKSVAESTHVPVSLVLVINPVQRQKAERWETVAVNRGMDVRIALNH